jgi:hypothetical protein
MFPFFFLIFHSSRSRLPLGLRPTTAADCLLGQKTRIPPRAWMSVSSQCCVLCRYRTLRWANPSTRGVLPSVCVCVCVSFRLMKCNNHPLYTYSEWVEQTGIKQLRSNIQCNKTVCLYSLHNKTN